MDTLISVVIPVYNVEKYLSQCIESVISQTYKCFEIILIDDGSKDDSGKICDEYAQKDNRIKVIHKKNEGVSAARNDGIDISSGELMYFLDADDWIEPTLFEEAVEKYNEKNVDAVFFDYVAEYSNKKVIEKSLMISDEYVVNTDNIEIIKSITRNGYIWNLLFKSSIIKANKIRLKNGLVLLEDMLFKFTCLSFIKTYSYIGKVFYHYRQLNSSAIHSSRKDYSIILKEIHREMYLQIEKEKYPPNAEIVPNSKYISYLSRVAENAFQGSSLKEAIKIINEYVDSEEYRKSILNYDKELVGAAGRIYVKFNNINWFVVWCVYILRKIKSFLNKVG